MSPRGSGATAEAPAAEQVDDEVQAVVDEAIAACDHVDDEDRSTIKVVGPDFPGYWSCVVCGHPFVSAMPIVESARDVVALYDRQKRSPTGPQGELMAAVDRLAHALPGAGPDAHDAAGLARME